MIDYKRTRHAAYTLNYHFVFCPKYRRAVLAGEVGDRLEQLLPELVIVLGGNMLELVVRDDHVHLFVSIPPTIAPQQVMHRIKGASSHILRDEFPSLRSRLPSLWTRSYFVGSAGEVSSATIRQYIEEQKGR